MNIALIGSGGREHALCRKLKVSKEISNIFCIPGNAGTAKISKNLNIDFLNFKLLLKTLKIYKIQLVIVGPEEPLVDGIVFLFLGSISKADLSDLANPLKQDSIMW